MTKTICDVCGKEIPDSICGVTIRDMNFCISSYGRIWDVCKECREDLKRWMTKRRAEMEEEE